jgi:probable rRNA maturation factor
MILLDPDLDPGPARSSKAARPPIPARPGGVLWLERIPSIPALGRFLAQARDAVRLRGHVSILLTTDAALRKLNQQFRGKNKATDVLSFPTDTQVQKQEKGDLAISVETARKQAREQGHALASELKILILHGLLHLAGYDHEADDGAMARREMKLRAKLGLPQGLIERAGSATQGLKPRIRLEPGSARLKSGPVTRPRTKKVSPQPGKSGPVTRPKAVKP